MAPEPPINPSDAFAPSESVECPSCDATLGLGVDLDYQGGRCPFCGTEIDEDELRDQVEAQREPPSWA
jgi:hypothetical protein